MAKAPTPHPDGFCDCGAARGEHIGDKPCTTGRNTATSLHQLPVFGWAWQGDARDRRA